MSNMDVPLMYAGALPLFYGVVESNNDPEKLGRVRVRILGVHTNPEISTGDLPWSPVSMPTTEGGVSGVGRIAGLLPGATVHGFFMDGPSRQSPLIIGAISKTESASDYQADQNLGYSMGNRVEQTNGIDPMGYNLGKTLDGFGFTDGMGGTNTEKAFNFFRGAGFTAQQAAGIVGNLLIESGNDLDPSTKQGDRGPGRGIAQWTKGGRWDTDPTNLKDYAARFGVPMENLEIQLMYIMHEYRDKPYWGLSTMRRTTTIEGATVNFMDKFERPRKEDEHRARRINAAQKVYRELAGSANSNQRPMPRPKVP
jgi:hypothetical protein